MIPFLPFRQAVFGLGLSISSLVLAQSNHIPGDVLVMLEPGIDARQVANAVTRVDGQPTGMHVVREVSAPMRTWLLHFDNLTLDQGHVLRALNALPEVSLAQSNHIVHDRAIPNDTQYSQQWQHQNIDSEAAWDLTTGGLTSSGDTIVVCIIENADLPHPDLVDNAWYNYHEIAGNGIDDDNNGYVDDFRGWNPAGTNDQVYGGSHGTQVAGMIGAKGNNGSQVAGANWNVKLMVVTRNGVAEDAVVESYTYPLVMRRLYNSSNGEQGAFVVATNASWGIDGADHTQFPIWCAMYDTLGTAGVLNCGATANNNVDIDQVDDMPTGCESDFMVSVTATDNNDTRTFSGYGATTIDVGAPGANVFTTSMGGGTGSTSGTSFASPLTAGVIALLYSAPCSSLMSLVRSDPRQGALYVRQALFDGVEQVGNLPGNCVTGGRINSYNSLLSIMNDCGVCPAPYNLAVQNSDIGEAMLQWSSNSATEFNVQVTPVDGIGGPVLDLTNYAGTSYLLSGLDACREYQFTVAAVCGTDTVSNWSDTLVWTSEGCCITPTGLQAGFMGDNIANVFWTEVLAGSSYAVRISPAGQNQWTETFGVGNAYYAFEGLEPCTDYDVQVRTSCIGNITDWSTSITVHTTGCGFCVEGIFCPSVSNESAYEWIDRVQVGTIDNQSGNNDGYGTFLDQSTTFATGVDYPITLTPGFATNTYPEYFKVFIDLNNDGSFTSPDELVYDAGATVQAPLSGTLTVPAGSPQGPTRMRVVMEYDAAPADGCTNAYDYGETEDYCVSIEIGNGLSEPVLHTFSMSPNPADAELTVVLRDPQYQRIRQMEVLNGLGQRVIALGPIGNIVHIPTSGLAPGMYFVRAISEAGTTGQARFEVAR